MMGIDNHILHAAKQRAVEKNLAYAGALTPREAYALLESDANVQLIDVRSRAELDLVGRIPAARHVEWSSYPGWQANPEFLAQLKSQTSPDTPVLFICRSGARSHNAAILAAQSGYAHAYNVLEGFEGDSAPDTKQRGTINGWKAAGLPWTNG